MTTGEAWSRERVTWIRYAEDGPNAIETLRSFVGWEVPANEYRDHPGVIVLGNPLYLEVSPGDYIVRHPDGTFTAHTPEDFAEKYSTEWEYSTPGSRECGKTFDSKPSARRYAIAYGEEPELERRRPAGDWEPVTS